MRKTLCLENNNDIKHEYVATRKILGGLAIRCDLAKATDRSIYFDRVYEKHIVDLIQKELRPGDIFIDIGSCIGYYALLASAFTGEKGQVIAFEPDKDNYSRLMKNISLNGSKNIVVHQKAVSNVNAELEFHINPLNNGGHSLNEFEDYSSARVDKVMAVRMDDFIDKELPGQLIKWVKIDVEGHQMEVLEGMSSLLARQRPRLIVEHPSDKENLLIEFLTNYNYKVLRIGYQDYYCYHE